MQKHLYLIVLLAVFQLTTAAGQTTTPHWQTIKNQHFTIHFTSKDSASVPALTRIFTKGITQTEAFFGNPFRAPFDIRIFPDRAALDRQWQQDWGDTSFHSQCWMVASGVAKQLDVLSPQVWSAEACEHNAADSTATFQLLLHELVHVYHGQYCASPDFTGMDDLGWWVEGLAVYASGQLDAARLERVRQRMAAGKVPASLSQFWSGPDKYGLSGSVVAALDQELGRESLVRLLAFSTVPAFFEGLGKTEAEVLGIWKESLK